MDRCLFFFLYLMVLNVFPTYPFPQGHVNEEMTPLVCCMKTSVEIFLFGTFFSFSNLLISPPSHRLTASFFPSIAIRACFKKLPRILSFNTMRYTFNMVTMMKEKVNTHFSFPLRLDMTPYTEDFLMGKGERKEGSFKLNLLWEASGFIVIGVLILRRTKQKYYFLKNALFVTLWRKMQPNLLLRFLV